MVIKRVFKQGNSKVITVSPKLKVGQFIEVEIYPLEFKRKLNKAQAQKSLDKGPVV
jgi:hypothetical protein